MTIEQLFELEAKLRSAAVEYANTDHVGGGSRSPVYHPERNAARKALRLAAVAYGRVAEDVDDAISPLVEPT